jgi:hypothetical protein
VYPSGAARFGKRELGAMPKRKVNLNGQEFSAEEISFESIIPEHWNEYALADGTSMKVKVVLADVLRVDGQWTVTGDPLYTVNAQVVVNTNSPENLKKKA